MSVLAELPMWDFTYVSLKYDLSLFELGPFVLIEG
jgi:hypothetical protein